MPGYGYGTDTISFWVFSAERPVPADEKSGLHFCFAAPDAAAVDAFHAAALRAGGHDNGAPGLRPVYGHDYYAASSSIPTDTGSKHITALAKGESNAEFASSSTGHQA
jgi:hypothetical protein